MALQGTSTGNCRSLVHVAPPMLGPEQAAKVNTALSNTLDAQSSALMATVDPKAIDEATIRRNVILQAVAHCISLLKDSDEEPEVMQTQPPAEKMRSELDDGPSKNIVDTVVEQELMDTPGAAPLVHWQGGPLSWRMRDNKVQNYLTNQKCLIICRNEPGYCANARTMRDSPKRAHLEAIFPGNEYAQIVGQMATRFSLQDPKFVSGEGVGTHAAQVLCYCPPDHVTLDRIEGESHAHGQCLNLEYLNKAMVKRNLDLLCTVTMRANLNIRYKNTVDEEFFVGFKIETIHVHKYVQHQKTLSSIPMVLSVGNLALCTSN